MGAMRRYILKHLFFQALPAILAILGLGLFTLWTVIELWRGI